MHIVLRSSVAKGKYSLLLYSKIIASEFKKQTRKHSIEVVRLANAGNHLHMILKSPSREQLKAFLRGFASTVARLILGVNRNTAKLSDVLKSADFESGTRRPNRFWDFIPWSTILSCYKAIRSGVNYLRLNSIEIGENLSRKFAREKLAWVLARESELNRKSKPLLPLGFV